jgi:hypothetical protein
MKHKNMTHDNTVENQNHMYSERELMMAYVGRSQSDYS